MTQNQSILGYLREGHSITPMEALELFQCWALSSRISEIQKLLTGLEFINSELVKLPNGKKVACYTLEHVPYG